MDVKWLKRLQLISRSFRQAAVYSAGKQWRGVRYLMELLWRQMSLSSKDYYSRNPISRRRMRGTETLRWVVSRWRCIGFPLVTMVSLCVDPTVMWVSWRKMGRARVAWDEASCVRIGHALRHRYRPCQSLHATYLMSVKSLVFWGDCLSVR